VTHSGKQLPQRLFRPRRMVNFILSECRAEHLFDPFWV
jgi:hypothetical protein